MPIVNLLFVGIIIGFNNLAAALALGALGQEVRRGRILCVFGIFEFFIPLLGIWIGQQASQRIFNETEWFGPVLLAGLGLWTILAGEEPGMRTQDKKLAERITTWSGLIFLAAGLSVDNLTIGFSLGLGGTDALAVASTIALFSVIFTIIGLRIGDASRKHWQQKTRIASGIVLVTLAGIMAMGWI